MGSLTNFLFSRKIKFQLVYEAVYNKSQNKNKKRMSYYY